MRLENAYSERLSIARLKGDTEENFQILLGLARSANSTLSADVLDSDKAASNPARKLRHSQLNDLARLLTDKLVARTIVVHRNVADEDYLAEYTTFYARTFVNYPKRCTRLHFFSESSNENEEPLDFLDRMQGRVATSRPWPPVYLGFITLRPVLACPVGKTILTPPDECKYITVKDTFNVHIAGAEFSVVGTPFLQQDASVGACVQASLWMALRAVRKRDNRPPYRVDQITQAATNGLLFAKIYPNRDGINGQQLVIALNQFGYHGFGFHLQEPRSNEMYSNPLGDKLSPFGIKPRPAGMDIKPANDNEAAESIRAQLYPYVESGIPVVLMCNIKNAVNDSDNHAVLLVGHGWPTTLNSTLIHFEGYWPRKHMVSMEEDGCSREIFFEWPTSVFAADFYVNDDSVGPYKKISHAKSEAGCIPIHSITHAFPLLPKDVYLDALDALQIFKQLLKDVFEGLCESYNGLNLSRINRLFLVRQRLLTSHEVRRWASKINNTSLSSYYRKKHLPKKIWHFALHDVNLYHKCPEGVPSQVGEILIDPTGDVDDYPLLTAHFHLPYILNQNRPLGDSDSAEANIRKGVVIDYNPDVRQVTFYLMGEPDCPLVAT